MLDLWHHAHTIDRERCCASERLKFIKLQTTGSTFKLARYDSATCEQCEAAAFTPSKLFKKVGARKAPQNSRRTGGRSKSEQNLKIRLFIEETENVVSWKCLSQEVDRIL